MPPSKQHLDKFIIDYLICDRDSLDSDKAHTDQRIFLKTKYF